MSWSSAEGPCSLETVDKLHPRGKSSESQPELLVEWRSAIKTKLFVIEVEA